ncbi:LysR family transcriptional regulator [Cupriavidus respiraculi]|uniref:HTH-type transcriptional regulator HdfR n=1 Tax=Cupriavidus respiraculi TaxID=195930 RepID=A0ABM8WIU3_9BURK|nr:LysR family transcriptional regulator [Cupriavidus respiraculi]MBY4948117.1 LysR family transcriptional regulator [Cupriavidus respiraculi]CAG9167200.1 HTH-type transcriptional regulator HdfR [Cupriavidus respiraculi]
MNWDDTRIFLALEREGTLRRAARVVGLDQATVGRRIAAMERALGATLFLRRSDGYALTPAGENVLRSAEKMEQFANELVRQAQGVDSRLEGEVKVTTTDSLALEFVIPAIARLHAAHPDVRVMLNTSTQMLNLARREADIAIRNIKPENPDLVTRLLARWPVGLYASAGYLEAHGEPEPGAGFAGHDLAIYQPYMAGNRMPTLVGEPIHAGRIVSGVNSSLMLRAMVRAGVAIGEIPVPLAERTGLVRIWPGRERAGRYEVWLVTHQDLRHTARVRAMIDAVAQEFAAGTAT